MATHLISSRIAASVSPAPIATKMSLCSTASTCGLAASARAQAKLLHVGSRVASPYEFPREDDAPATFGCPDLDEDVADISDGADARTHLHLVTDVKIHLRASRPRNDCRHGHFHLLERHGHYRPKSSRGMANSPRGCQDTWPLPLRQ